MSKLLAIFLCIAFPLSAFAAENGYKVVYDGGSLPNAKVGASFRLHIESNSIQVAAGKDQIVEIPATAVTEISYGQDVHRRVGAAIGVGLVSFGVGALLALAKSKKHFIGLTWNDNGKKGRVRFPGRQERLSGSAGGPRRHHWKEGCQFRCNDSQELKDARPEPTAFPV